VDAYSSLNATGMIVPTQLAYMHIPSNELRLFVDGLFPALAKNSIADSVAGYGHRYRAGHDLLFDIPKTIGSNGPLEGIKHAGHVLLTDFPTKAGIPIPGLSQSGLGQLLEQAGIHRGWMQVNLCDTGVGFYAIAEGSSDLALALQGVLEMNTAFFFDTFVEGSIEIGLALVTKNPFLMVGGIENILAGIVASWKTLSFYVDPLYFFGAAGTSALIGFSLAYGLAGENLCAAGKDAIRSGAIGALFTLSPAFGFGAFAGFTAFRLGCIFANQQERNMNACLSIDEQTYRLLWDEICKGNEPVIELLNLAMPQFRLLDSASILQNKVKTLADEVLTLSTKCLKFETNVPRFQEKNSILEAKVTLLPNDPSILIDCYRTFGRI